MAPVTAKGSGYAEENDWWGSCRKVAMLCYS